MYLGICTRLAGLNEAAEAGFAFAEISTGELLSVESDADFSEVADRIRNAPLPVEAANCFIPGTIKVTGFDVDVTALRGHMEKVLRRAGEAGLSIMVFGSGGARKLPDGFSAEVGWDQLTEAALMAAEIGDRYGVTIVMEPLFKPACNLLNRVDQGVTLVDRVGHPRLKLLGDLFHMQAEAEPVENLIVAGDRLGHIHLATPSIPATGEGIAYDFPAFFEALNAAGYDGRVSVEDNPGLLAKHKPPLTPIYREMITFLNGMMH